MKIRFGYVAMSTMLKNASPSRTVTAKAYRQLAENNPEAAKNKVRRAGSENLFNTLRILRHNKAYGVAVYRFSSKIIPLATHPLLADWNYTEDFRDQLTTIGDFVRENNMRVSFHPDHYTLINSPKEEVFLSSLKDLEHHCLLFEEMGLSQHAKLVMHVGGGYQDKENSLERFQENWKRLTRRLTERLTLENDDKTFTAKDVLLLCNRLSLPMVLDLHHFKCNNEGETLKDLLPLILLTWNNTDLPAKFHISSSRNQVDFRSHHDFVNPEDLYPFLKLAREINVNIDVMVEAKQKDRAMFQLVKELSAYPLIKQINEATLFFN
ncbi:MAG: UV DNA damage repair endonuclease UvsE [Desulfotomaculaceae bacterium]|nr:UV DNA damage repair endonuclease UvsE [Desulfotomaculaceae bacterium]